MCRSICLRQYNFFLNQAIIPLTNFETMPRSLQNNSHNSLLAATDSILSFIPFADFVEGSKLQPLLASFDEVASQPGLSPLQQKQYIIQREWLTQLTVPQLEIILYSRGFINPAAGESYITLLGGNQHPLGRGSVHVDSNDPLAPPLIAANYLNNPFGASINPSFDSTPNPPKLDTSVAVEFVRFATSLLNIDSLASVAQNVTHPASFEDADILSHVKATIAPGCHILGSASMAPYNIGGVVDSELKVYNTTNLRVVDASIIPIHVGAHVQSLVYVIAEKAADIIQASSY
ncbi:hypothetical protein D9615_000802 [Tricholomella constricta]|uniref:Glucose-methanol-choline oxidoreductase C-terminal domain-containing protein n=1 Tax=Tricholomella constricta TaxID=117010 RepID=A0A8H5MC05_9AGAR|nr:hypothetical protein D9615_000802 [Tricholomella constricta]